MVLTAKAFALAIQIELAPALRTGTPIAHRSLLCRAIARVNGELANSRAHGRYAGAISLIPVENRMDRLASMETFVRVVETGSFSRQLRVGQPAVSKSVAQLEEYLGVKLLTRSTRGLTPTEAGLGYLERARRALEEAAEAELAARGAGAGLKGRLRICAAVTFARIHLIPLLPKFLAQNPDLELEVILDDRQIDLVQEGIDVALRMGKLMDSALTARCIARCKRLVLGTPAYFEHAFNAKRLEQASGRCLSSGGQRLVVSARNLRIGGLGSKQITRDRRGRCESCCARRYRTDHRVRVDVHSRTAVGCGPRGVAGMGSPRTRSLGCVSLRTGRDGQDKGVREFLRAYLQRLSGLRPAARLCACLFDRL
jgi:DNA-binding transcriptional LysR family regulator